MKFLGINRFKVDASQTEVFEKVWREREGRLSSVPGFLEFKLLRGEVLEQIQEYLSHTVWDSKESFEKWTESQAFKDAHKNSKMPKGVITAHPQFEGYDILLEES